MISAAQDYMFVSFGAGIAVDGEIMPKRADKSLLRGVDAGFLREAYEERRVAAGGTRASPVDLNGEIRASWLSSVAAGYEDLVSRTVGYGSGRFVKPVQLSARLATSYPPIADYGMDFPVSSLTSNKAAFSSGSRLDKDAVLALFTDAQALRPFLLAGLVSSDVDVVRRKDLHYLVEDIFKEFVGLRISGTEFTACVGPTLAAQLRMGDENCIGMCREFDFGDYLDVVRSGIFNYFPEFILGVITAIGIRSTLVKIALVLLVPPLNPAFLSAAGAFGS